MNEVRVTIKGTNSFGVTVDEATRKMEEYARAFLRPENETWEDIRKDGPRPDFGMYTHMCWNCDRLFGTNLSSRVLCSRCATSRERWLDVREEPMRQAWLWETLYEETL